MNAAPTHPTILLIDDNATNLGVLAGYLRGHGFHLMVARNGRDGIEKAKLGRPDLILLDVMMPDMNGFETCRRLKSEAETAAIPVIFITALQSAEDKVKGFSAGGVDYITKPLQEEEVLARVTTHVALYHSQKALEAEIEKRKQVEHTLRQYMQHISILNWMSHVLHACQTEEETYHVIINVCSKLFPSSSGSLLIPDETHSRLNVTASWKEPPPETQQIRLEDFAGVSPDDVHIVEHPEIGSLCSRVNYTGTQRLLCVPIFSSKILAAVISISFEQEPVDSPESEWGKSLFTQMFISEIVEYYTLALDNLRLRETLRIESIHDPLTGLYNRRHMEAALDREAHRVLRRQSSLGILMFDIDHFKIFNDTYGHEAGDVVLQKIGTLLKQHSRKEDIACRYGGEEFICILPDATLDLTTQRAEKLLRDVQALDIPYQEKHLKVTISIGVAAFPAHGTDISGMICIVDTALYQAKRNGRNQVVAAN